MGAAQLRVELLDPTTLLVDTNVRHDLRLDADFVASVREHGVLVPIVAVRTGDGGIRVRHGHRRTLAACQAGRGEVPVVIIGADGDSDAEQIARLLHQHAENTHRTGLSTAEQVDVFTQLAAFGLSPTQIAKRTRTRKTEVAAALAVADSELATAATGRHAFLTLSQAAVVAEHDGDADAVKALITAARSGQFDHVAQRLHDDRVRAQAAAELTEALTAAGVTVIDPPDYGDKTIIPLRDLCHDGQPLTDDTHAGCPGRAAYLRASWGDPPVQAVSVCTDPKTHGHTPRHGGSLPTGSGPLSEQEKADRARVRENNTAWRSAETVRRDWLRTFLTRKTAPKDAPVFIAASLTAGDHALRRALERGHPLGRDLLGSDTGGQPARRVDIPSDAGSPGRAQMLTLGLVLAAYEDATDVHTWRNPDAATRRYLAYLVANGYTPSDVEQLVIGGEDPADTRSEPDADPRDASAA